MDARSNLRKLRDLADSERWRLWRDPANYLTASLCVWLFIVVICNYFLKTAIENGMEALLAGAPAEGAPNTNETHGSSTPTCLDDNLL